MSAAVTDALGFLVDLAGAVAMDETGFSVIRATAADLVRAGRLSPGIVDVVDREVAAIKRERMAAIFGMGRT